MCYHSYVGHADISRIKKSLWRDKKSSSWSFFCPNCRADRKIPFHPHPGRLKHFVQIGLTAVFFTLCAWPLFGAKGIVAFVPIWAIFEVIYRTKVRAVISCPHCGFDPYLYLSDVKRAREEIEKHWKAKFAEKGIPFPGAEEPPAGINKKESNRSLTETRPGS